MNQALKRNPSLFAFAVIALLTGCDSPSPSDSVKIVPALGVETPQPQSEVASALESQMKENASLNFDSSDGQFTLSLFRDGVAKVKYTEDDDVSSGVFSIDEQDRLLLDFGPDDLWLPMPINLADQSLVIGAPSREEFIQVMVQSGIGREDITDEDLDAALQSWPLKAVNQASKE